MWFSRKSKLGICQTKWILLWTGGIQGRALLAELRAFCCLVRQISRGYGCFLRGDVRHNNAYIRRRGTSAVITTRVLATLISMHRSRFRNIQIEQMWHLKCIFPFQVTSINPRLYGFKYFSAWVLMWFFLCVCVIFPEWTFSLGFTSKISEAAFSYYTPMCVVMSRQQILKTGAEKPLLFDKRDDRNRDVDV